MKTIEAAGYTWKRNQKEGLFRLKQIDRNRDKYSLYHWYKNPSDDKYWAYQACVMLCNEMQASAYTIVSASIFQFTFAFYTINSDNGVINRVYWITRDNKYYADI